MQPPSRPSFTDMAPSLGDSTPREVRAQMVQRLQVGLFGLSLMLLLVGLANIIMEHARRNDAAPVAATQTTSNGASPGTSDPLADIGVVPSPDAAASKRAGSSASSAGR